MDSYAWLSFLAGVMEFFGFMPYLLKAWQGKTAPRKATWIIFTCLNGIMLVGMFWKRSLNGPITIAFICAGIAAALALWKGNRAWKLHDKLCLTGAAAAIIIWWLLRDPSMGILIAALVTIIGGWPTVRES